MNASFEEKSAWIMLVSLVIIATGYHVFAAQMWANGVDILAAYVPLFTVAVVLLVTALIAGHVLAAILNRPDSEDERDKLVGLKAESNSSWLLGVGVLLAIGHMVVSTDSVLTAHILMLALFASEILKCALQVFYYRRGF